MAGKYETHVEPHLKKIEEMASKGGTQKEIAKALGVAYSSFRNYVKQYAALQGALTANLEQTNLEAVGAFYRKVTGYRYTETTKELVDGKMVVTKKVEKVVPPDVSAGQFWLTNMLPDKFKNRQEIKTDVEVKKLEDFEEWKP